MYYPIGLATIATAICISVGVARADIDCASLSPDLPDGERSTEITGKIDTEIGGAFAKLAKLDVGLDGVYKEVATSVFTKYGVGDEYKAYMWKKLIFYNCEILKNSKSLSDQDKLDNFFKLVDKAVGAPPPLDKNIESLIENQTRLLAPFNENFIIHYIIKLPENFDSIMNNAIQNLTFNESDGTFRRIEEPGQNGGWIFSNKDNFSVIITVDLYSKNDLELENDPLLSFDHSFFSSYYNLPYLDWRRNGKNEEIGFFRKESEGKSSALYLLVTYALPEIDQIASELYSINDLLDAQAYGRAYGSEWTIDYRLEAIVIVNKPGQELVLWFSGETDYNHGLMGKASSSINDDYNIYTIAN